MKKISLSSPVFYSGLSGLNLPGNKSLSAVSSEPVSRLTFYASLFNSIEINSSFYKVPQQSTVTKWNNSVPVNFKFTFKLWKEITHNKGLKFNKFDVEVFFHAMDPAKDKKGCILIQLPPSLTVEYIDQFSNLLNCIYEADANQWKIATEFRNTSWYTNDTYNLLKDYNVGLVIQDMPVAATPLLLQKSDFVYLRFHGPTGNYRGTYSEHFLSEYSVRIAEWVEQGKDVYSYFNNTMGEAFNNLLTLNSLLHRRHANGISI